MMTINVNWSFSIYYDSTLFVEKFYSTIFQRPGF